MVAEAPNGGGISIQPSLASGRTMCHLTIHHSGRFSGFARRGNISIESRHVVPSSHVPGRASLDCLIRATVTSWSSVAHDAAIASQRRAPDGAAAGRGLDSWSRQIAPRSGIHVMSRDGITLMLGVCDRKFAENRAAEPACMDGMRDVSILAVVVDKVQVLHR